MVSTRTQRAATAPEAMVVPGRHAHELVALRAEYEERLASLRTDCQMQLAVLATTLCGEHEIHIAAVTTTLQQEHQEALAATTAALYEAHSTKETALTTQLSTLAAQHDASLERARVLHTLAKRNHRLQTTIATTAVTSQMFEAQLRQAKTNLATSTLATASKDNLVISLEAKLELTSSNLARAEHSLSQTKRDLVAPKAAEDDNAIRLREATSRIKSMGERLQMLQADLDGHEQRALYEAAATDDALVSHQNRIDELLGQLAVAKFAACSAQLVHGATIKTKDETIRSLYVDLDGQQAKVHEEAKDQLRRDLVTNDELGQVRNLQGQLDAAQAQLSATPAADLDPRSVQAVCTHATEEPTQVLQLARNQATMAKCRESLALKEASVGRHEDTYDVRHHRPRISVHRVQR